MKKIITLISAVLLFAMVATATDEPKYEVYLGYQYLRNNTFNDRFFNEDLGVFQDFNSGFDMHGGVGEFIYNVNHWASFVVNAGAVDKGNAGIGTLNLGISDTTAFVYGGPRFYYRRHHKGLLGLTPFGEILFGGAFRHLSTQVTAVTVAGTPTVPIATPLGILFPGPLTVVDAELKRTDNAFSMKVGGGLDWTFGKHFGFRPIQVDYVLTRFPGILTGVTENRNSVAASAGFLFTWGAR